MDDFGTGYSSLSQLRQLPIDEVKIDKSFVLGMSTSQGESFIARSIIELAHNLGLRVVAEGVEDELTRNLLAEMGCDKLQGFLVSRPLPDDRLESWLLARTGVRSAAPGAAHRRLFVRDADPRRADPLAEVAGSWPRYSLRRLFEHAPLAQSAERLHGKEKVYGSIP